MGAVAIGGRAFLLVDSNLARHPEVRVLFTRLEGCTPPIPVAASFEGRATIVRYFH
jgi:hypothetical protein